jgi:hypothetical protein
MTEQANNRDETDPVFGTPRTPRRRAIAAYENYADAERAVDRLSDLRFPVERVAIVGHDLKVVEQVTGRLNYGGAALKGAVSGALPGALIGWIFGLFSLVNPLVASLLLALYGLIIGAVIGAVLGLIMHAMQHGRRDFDAVSMMVPSRYEVLVDDEVADEAARLLADAPVIPAQTDTAAANATKPPSARPDSTSTSTTGTG